jgi:hypothetical protein
LSASRGKYRPDGMLIHQFEGCHSSFSDGSSDSRECDKYDNKDMTEVLGTLADVEHQVLLFAWKGHGVNGSQHTNNKASSSP